MRVAIYGDVVAVEVVQHVAQAQGEIGRNCPTVNRLAA